MSGGTSAMPGVGERGRHACHREPRRGVAIDTASSLRAWRSNLPPDWRLLRPFGLRNDRMVLRARPRGLRPSQRGRLLRRCAPRNDRHMKILAVCGMGLGSGLLLRMQAEKALRQLGIDADLEVADIGSARAMAQTADLILTSNELAEQLGKVKPRVVTISNFVDLKEMVEKLRAALVKT